MRILVIRTSAMGDVALTIPVIAAMREQHPDVGITLLTRKEFSNFFQTSGNLNLFIADFSRRHRGIPGLIRMCRDIIKTGEYDHVIDLHDVIRTRVLRFFFRMAGIPVSVIDKGRQEKRALIKGVSRQRLRHTTGRYYDTFARAGLLLEPTAGPWIIPNAGTQESMIEKTGFRPGINIGVAPFSKHSLKEWPVENMIKLLNRISETSDAEFWLFGGRSEAGRLDELRPQVPGSHNIAGKLNLHEELALMARLSFMISMDSSNMHMAALTGTKVISIWGATDPATGFGAWMQPGEYSLSIPYESLQCRPCTVYGKGKCRRKDHACMNWLTPEIVFQKISDLNIL